MPDAALAVGEVGDGPRVAWFLHGILGSGRNWRSFARQLGDRCPGWRFVLPDLRNHGATGPLDGRTSLAACAEDLASLPEPEVVVGHSFGGKVALEYARTGRPARAVFVLDSVPVASPRSGDSDVLRVLAALREVRIPASDRQDVRRDLLARGLPGFLVDWVLTSLRQEADGWRWAWDLDGIERMMEDYFLTDYGPWLGAHAGRPAIRIVRAGRSDRWTPDVLERLRLGPSVRLDVLPNAGHWLHVDDPSGLLDLLVPSFA